MRVDGTSIEGRTASETLSDIGAQSSSTLVGMIAPFAHSSTPTGFLACDGAAVSRSTYSALFSAIGTTWGTGDGSSTFNVPDLRGAILGVLEPQELVVIMWARVSAVIRMTRMLNTITQHHPLPPLLFLVLQTQLVITVIATLALLLIIQVRDCLHITIQTVVLLQAQAQAVIIVTALVFRLQHLPQQVLGTKGPQK